MSKPSVLITGSGGFIGGWVAEQFHLEGDMAVRAGIRRVNTAVRIARFPMEIVACDILDTNQLHRAMEGVDAVVHCAIGDESVAIQGTKNVLEAARSHGVQGVVHLSSIAVYGKPSGVITEDSPPQSKGNPYSAMKIEAENVCRTYADKDVPVVMLRPTIVYGPYSAQWTQNFALRLLSRKWGTFGKAGEGFANLVYVTDVVQAIRLSLKNKSAAGQAFNVNGSEIITWNEYFERFNRELGLDPLPKLSANAIKLRALMMQPVRTVGKAVLARQRALIMKIYKSSALFGGLMKTTESSLKLTPTPEQIKLYGTRAEYRIDKARKMLGYEPRIGIAEGLRLSHAWLDHHGLLY